MNLFDTTNLFSRFQAFHKVLSPTRPKELKFFVAKERFAAKLIIIKAERITNCSLLDEPDHTKKWGNKLHVQNNFRLRYL